MNNETVKSLIYRLPVLGEPWQAVSQKYDQWQARPFLFLLEDTLWVWIHWATIKRKQESHSYWYLLATRLPWKGAINTDSTSSSCFIPFLRKRRVFLRERDGDGDKRTEGGKACFLQPHFFVHCKASSSFVNLQRNSKKRTQLFQVSAPCFWSALLGMAPLMESHLSVGLSPYCNILLWWSKIHSPHCNKSRGTPPRKR